MDSAPLLRSLLAEAATARQKVVVVVNDPHRATPTRLILTALSEYARALEVPFLCRLLVATGAHVFDASESRAFEERTFSRCGLPLKDIAWHDARDDASHVAVGHVRIDRLLADSRFLIPIGSVEPHYFAGVTGPHKTLSIGCMSYADIERNHGAALDLNARPFRLDGNPVFDDMERTVRALGEGDRKLCAIGVVCTEGTLIEAAVGDPIEVTERLLPLARHIYSVRVRRPVDVLRLRVRPPLDRTLYQADKALKNCHSAVRDGGGILLEAACHDGVGPSGFIDMLRRAPTHAESLRLIDEHGYRLGDHKAVKLRHVTDPACRNVRIALISRHLTATDLHDTGISLFRTASSALNWLASTDTNPLKSGLVIEDAALVCAAMSADG